jgi:hypothetical protein
LEDPTIQPAFFLQASSATAFARQELERSALRLNDKDQQGLCPIMSILAWIVVGIIAGWLAERITGRSQVS